MPLRNSIAVRRRSRRTGFPADLRVGPGPAEPHRACRGGPGQRAPPRLSRAPRLRVPRAGSLWGWAMHHYAWNASGGRTTDWSTGKRDAVKFDAEQYYEILREADEMESLIAAHWAVMAESDPRHRTKLVVDEWGGGYASGTEPFPEALIGQQNTMPDGGRAGLTLDTFNRHADKVAMAAVAQLVNCLQS